VLLAREEVQAVQRQLAAAREPLGVDVVEHDAFDAHADDIFHLHRVIVVQRIQTEILGRVDERVGCNGMMLQPVRDEVEDVGEHL
jgi:hypothetical protein